MTPVLQSILTAVLGFGLLAVVFLPLERAHLRRRQPILRPAFATDCAFFFGQALLWTVIATSVLSGFAIVVQQLPLSPVRGIWAEQPWLLQAVEVLLLGDLVVYWAHRASHRIPLLWRFHRVHHTAEHLDWLAAFREHPLDGLYTQLWLNLPALLLGFPIYTIAGVAAFRGMWGVYIHSNVRLSPGPLKLLVGLRSYTTGTTIPTWGGAATSPTSAR